MIDGKLLISDVISGILYNQYGKMKADELNFYLEENFELVFLNRIVLKGVDENYKILWAYTQLENILLQDKNNKKGINLFLGHSNYPSPLWENMDFDDFYNRRWEFYRNSGRSKNFKSPMSIIGVSPSVLDYVYLDKKETVINHNIIPSSKSEIVELIWAKIVEKNYYITSYSRFCDDIITPFFRTLSKEHSTFYHYLFKDNLVFKKEEND